MTGRTATLAYLTSRLGLLLLAYVGLRWFALPFDAGEWRAFPEALWLDGWARFDSGWYWSIARRGYYGVEQGWANAAFFPLYPLIVYPLSLPLRAVMSNAQSFYAAGIVVSHAAFAVGLIGVARLGRELVGEAATQRALWLLALYPFSYFFSAAYTEAVYLALTVWAFYLARRDRWLAACVLASLCAVTRIPGFLVAVGLAAEYLRRYGWSRFVRHGLAVFWLTPVPLAVLLIYFWIDLGDPFAFIAAQQAWARSVEFLAVEVHTMVSGGSVELSVLYGVQLAFLAVATFLSVLAWWKLGWGYSLFALLSLLIPAYSALSALGRYAAVAFPAFLMGGALLHRQAAFYAILVAFVPLLALFTWWFTNWHLAI